MNSPARRTAPAAETHADITSDKQLISWLKMTEADAARALGRSKQSLYQARLEEKQNYFKKGDLAALIFSALSRDSTLDLDPIFSYLDRTRKPGEVADLRALGASDADEHVLAQVGELWFVLPDYTHFLQRHSEALAFLLRLAARPSGRTRIFCATEQDKALIENAVLRASNDPDIADRVHVDPEPWMSAFQPTLVADPHRVAECYIFLRGRFMRNDWFGGPKLALFLEKLTQSDLVSRRA